jgi:RNA polymerase sigma factor (TIGR02999 family)
MSAASSNDESCGVVTQLMNEAAAGNARAASELLPLVYERLRALAGRKMQQERAGQTLQATALVHEAYLRLVDTDSVQSWDSRWHFYSAAAESMRRILVENARRKGRLKRGASMNRVELNNLELAVDEPPDDLLALDEALNHFSAAHPAKAELIKLRFFGGLSQAEAAQALGLSASTADRHWAFGRAWLYRHMSDAGTRRG